jgi:hypothetical protein
MGNQKLIGPASISTFAVVSVNQSAPNPRGGSYDPFSLIMMMMTSSLTFYAQRVTDRDNIILKTLHYFLVTVPPWLVKPDSNSKALTVLNRKSTLWVYFTLWVKLSPFERLSQVIALLMSV